MDQIKNLDGQVVAVSVDSAQKNLQVQARHGLDFPLLSDPDLVAIDAFGLRHPKGMLDNDIARPATFILDREGRIVWKELTDNWRIRIRPGPVLEQLQKIP
jgi:peroxiredoxin